MNNHLSKLLLLVTVFLSAHSLAATTYYVAPTGSDNWSGTLDAQSGNDGPFKTIARARNAVRAEISLGMTSDITVLIRGGEYPDTMINFDSADAGRNGFKVIYRNYPGEQPTVYSGHRLTGWQLDSGNIYKAPVNRAFDTLYENGARSIKARYPDVTNNTVYSRTSTKITGYETTKFGFDPGDIPVVDSPSDLEVVIWPGGPDGIWNWNEYIFAANSIDYGVHVVTLGHESRFTNQTAAPWPIGVGSRYFVQGAQELLDQPGEFWVGDGYVYYWPRQTPIGNQVIIAPGADNAVFSFWGPQGVAQAFNIRIEGLTIGYTDRDWPAVNMGNAANVTIKGNHILNTGSNGISAGGMSTGITIEGNLIHDVGQGGIATYGDATVGYPTHFLITNNYIHHAGQIRADGNGITLGGTSDSTVSHNLIHDIPRTGLRSYGRINNATPVYDAATNTFEFNDVSRSVTDSQDSGPAHFSGVGPGILINNNRFHDSDLPFSYGEGIYLDVCNVQVTISNNLVDGLQRTISGGITFDGIQLKGQDLTVSNNIVAQNQLSRGAIDTNKADTGGLGGCPAITTERNSMIRNILASNSTNTLYSFPQFEQGQVSSADYNLFFSSTGMYQVGFGYGNSVTTFSSSTQTLDQWRSSQSLELHSIVADPRFVDAPHGDFRLRPDSPAYGLGFRDIDFAAIGLTADFPFADPSESVARLFLTTDQSGPSSTVQLSLGGTAQIEVSGRTVTGYLVTPSPSALSYSSDQPTVASVDGQGNITTGNKGLATVTVSFSQDNGTTISTVIYVLVKFAQTITFESLPGMNSDEVGAYSLSAASSSGLVVTFTSLTPEICAVDGNRVSAINLGTCTIAANQGGNADYAPAATFNRSFQILASRPDAFSFPVATGVLRGMTVISSTVAPTNFIALTSIAVSGGSYSINGGAFTTTQGTINPGDSVRVQLASSTNANTQTCVTLTIGGVQGQFCATTAITIEPIIELLLAE